MRRLIFSLLCIVFFSGCFMNGVKHDYSNIKEDVFLDSHHMWSNSSVNGIFNQNGSSLRSITLRLINRKYCDVKVTVKCYFQPEEVIFGENTIVVEARNDKLFTVRGFSRITPEPETVGCQIVEIK